MSSTTNWMDYVNVLVNETECIKRAAIIGYHDASMWACSEDFKASAEELHQLVHQFSNSVVPRIAHLEGVPFIVPHATPAYVFGQKLPTCLHAFKRNKVVVVAVTEHEDRKEVPGFAAAKKVADYLELQGF